MLRSLLFFLVALSLPGCRGDASPGSTVVLISLDGFRPDYIERFEAPNLARMAESGVFAKDGMIPVFPSKTFPNHYSIVTGLYPAGHGIVGNTMYDPDMDEWFRISDREAVEDTRWWGGEPIWVTAEKQGVTAGTFFWPGSEAPVQGVQATHWRRFDNSIPASERIDTVLEWLELPDASRPRVVTLYFSDTDNAGHDHGIDSPEVAAAVSRVDRHIGRLLDQIDQRGLGDHVNVIVVSDHGMTNVSPERVIYLEDYFDRGDNRITEYSPVLMIEPESGRRQQIEDAIDRMPHVTRYDSAELEELFHFVGNPRIPSVVAVADDGWTISSTRAYVSERIDRFPKGMHGFDSRDPAMAALFLATGPAFVEGQTVPPFEAVDVYPLMARILDLEPADQDGRLERVSAMLR